MVYRNILLLFFVVGKIHCCYDVDCAKCLQNECANHNLEQKCTSTAGMCIQAQRCHHTLLQCLRKGDIKENILKSLFDGVAPSTSRHSSSVSVSDKQLIQMGLINAADRMQADRGHVGMEQPPPTSYFMPPSKAETITKMLRPAKKEELLSKLNVKCELYNKSVSLDDNLTRYHCSRQGSRQEEVVQTVLDELGLIWPVKNIRKGPSLIVQSLDGVLNGDLTIDEQSDLPPLIKDAVISAYDNAHPLDKHLAHTVKKYIFPRATPEASGPLDVYRTWFFLDNMSSKIDNATLHFYVDRPRSSTESRKFKYSIWMYKYLSNDAVSDNPEVQVEKHIDEGETGTWDTIDVSDLVSDWIKTPKKNLGLMLKAKSKETSDDVIVQNKMMFLEVDLSPKNVNPKISEESLPNDCTMNSNKHNSTCCRYPLTVDFERFGWDWVISPKRYQAYYCAGHCVHDTRKQSIHSAMLDKAQRLNLTSEGSSMSLLLSTKTSACCTPQQILSRNIIYEDEAGNIKNQSIPGMIVVSCGCA